MKWPERNDQATFTYFNITHDLLVVISLYLVIAVYYLLILAQLRDFLNKNYFTL